MEVTCYWIIISLKNQSHTVSKRNRLFGPKSGFLKERSYNWWIQVLLKDVIVQWCNDLYLRFLLQTRGQNKIWLKRLTSLTWQPKDWLTALKRWSPLEPEWSHWVQMPMDICLHGHTTTSQRWGRDLAGLKERERERERYNYYYFLFFLSFECVDHWRCQPCVQCTKFPPLKVKQMEAELWSHLSALKAEIEENRGAGSSNAYRFVCDVLFKLRLPKG